MRSMNQDHSISQHPNHSPQMTNQVPSNKKIYEKSQQLKKTISLFPLSFKEIFERLVNIGKIILIIQKPSQPPYPKWYDTNQTYEYHDGTSGHNIESCYAFKDKLLQLIEVGWITFEETPNMNSKV